jgi:hypothetical protein
MPSTFRHDPEAVLDYSTSWSSWLDDGETISSYTVTVPAGLTLASDSEDAGVVTAWISGGTAGENYRVEYKITTSAGRTDERSITISVRER